MDGQDALVLVWQKEDYHLRFYEGASRRYRDLGVVPLASAQLSQSKQSDGNWIFVLSGVAKDKPVIVAAGLNGVHGLLEGATSPHLEMDSLTFTDAAGKIRSLPFKAILASDMTGIYQVGSDPGKVQYAQFLRDGTGVETSAAGQPQIFKWSTDGEQMIVVEDEGKQRFWPRVTLTAVSGVPAATRLSVRLQRPLASGSVSKGDPIKATLISPATIENKILLPQGSQFTGTVTEAHGVGLGVKHETAALTLDFNSVTTPDGRSLAVHTRLNQVENSRETVDKQGQIEGIRSTATPGHAAENKVASVASFDPVAYLFANTGATAALGFAEPEILYPAGTEMLIQFTAPLVTAKQYPRTVPEFPDSEAGQRNLSQLVRSLPFRTATKASNKPSDLTNLVFIGPIDGLQRAFAAAGWIAVDMLNAGSTFMTLKTVGGNQVYNQAPMSILLLDERPPVLTLTKTTDTFSSRHHLRVFDPLTKFEGQPVLTSSSTQDIGIAFSAKQKTFIHVIDQYIDNERSKVVNDLEFTGCVEAMDLVPRPWAPQDAFNSTGDRLRTDGAVAVMRISECTHPRTTSNEPAEPPARVKRVTRDTILTLRNDIYRGNLIYQGVTEILWTKKYFATRDQLKPDEGAWRKTDQSGTEFKAVGNIPRERQSSQSITTTDAATDEAARKAEDALVKAHRWDPPHYELSVHGGYLNYPVKRQEFVTIVAIAKDLSNVYATGFGNEFKPGWTLGVSLSLNTWKWISNDFAYTYERGVYQYANIFTQPNVYEEEGKAGLVTREFDYDLRWNLRPPKSRWRPYIVGGPSLVLTSLADATLKKPAGPFRLGLQNVGLLISAFDFGGTAPLDGGGVFALGLQYGAGIRYRVHPRITISADFRETWTRNPQFITDSYTREYFIDDGYNSTVTHNGLNRKYQLQRFTLGVGFTF